MIHHNAHLRTKFLHREISAPIMELSPCFRGLLHVWPVNDLESMSELKGKCQLVSKPVQPSVDLDALKMLSAYKWCFKLCLICIYNIVFKIGLADICEKVLFLHTSYKSSYLIRRRTINSSAEAGMFQEKMVNTMTADALALCVARPSAAIVLTMQHKLMFVFHCE